MTEVSDYFCGGSHAIVGCDDSTQRSILANSIEAAVAGRGPFVRISGSPETIEREFELMLRESCNELLATLGETLPVGVMRIDDCLNKTMHEFRSSAHQGFLLVDQIDGIIHNQRPYMVEAALRTVMQHFDDVAIVLSGSNGIVMSMCDADRPFHHSIRVFRL